MACKCGTVQNIQSWSGKGHFPVRHVKSRAQWRMRQVDASYTDFHLIFEAYGDPFGEGNSGPCWRQQTGVGKKQAGNLCGELTGMGDQGLERVAGGQE